MPRSKNWRTYPDAYHELLEKAAVDPVVIPCETAKDAMSFRGQLYGFNSALETEAKKKDGDERARQLRHFSTKVQYIVEGNVLTVRPHDMDPRVQQVRRALASNELAQGSQEVLPMAPPQFLQDLAKEDATSKGK